MFSAFEAKLGDFGVLGGLGIFVERHVIDEFTPVYTFVKEGVLNTSIEAPKS